MASNFKIKGTRKVNLSQGTVVKFIIFIVIQVVFLVTLHYLLLSRGKTIQSFDETVQHSNFIHLNRILKTTQNNKLATIIGAVSQSIINDDYNLLSVLPLSIINLFLNLSSRENFIYLIYFVYVLPCFLLFYATSKLLNYDQKATTTGFFFSNLFFFFNPIILINLIRGQSTIDGAILILFILNIFIKDHSESNQKLPRLILLGILLGLLPALHRWYSFFAISFLITYAVTRYPLPTRKNYIVSIIEHALSTILLVLISAYTLICISGNLWRKYVTTDYSVAYQDFNYYNHLGILPSLHFTFSQIGYLYIILFLVSIRFYISRNPRHISLLLLPILTIFTFLRVQDFAYHHYFLLLIPIFLPFSAYWLSSRHRKLTIYLPLFLVFSFYNTFFYGSPVNQRVGLFPTEYVSTPPYDNRKLTDSLVNYLVNRPDIKKIYFASNVPYYNTSSLSYYTCCLHQNYTNLCHQIAPSAYLINRDPFPSHFPDANYVLTITPDVSNPATEYIQRFVSDNPSLYQKESTELTDGIYQISIYRSINTPSLLQIEALAQKFSHP